MRRPKLFETIELALARTLFALPPQLQLRLSGRPQIVVDGLPLDPGMQLLLAISRQAGRLRTLSHDSLAVARRRMYRETTRFGRTRPPVGAVRDFTIAGPAGPLPVRHYAPPDARVPEPLLVFLHGGGFALGDLDTHDYPCRVLCRAARVHVLSVAYRLAPEHPYPAAVEDTLAALRYGQAHAAELGADPARVALGGDSAGAKLTAIVAQQTRAHRPPVAPRLIYPKVDLGRHWPSRAHFARGYYLTGEDIDWFDAQYAGQADPDDPGHSPLRAADLSNLPPALLLTCGFDPLRDEGEAYAEALRKAGNRVIAWREPGLLHGFLHMAQVSPTAARALTRIAIDFRALLP